MTTARLIGLVRLDPTLRDLNLQLKDEEICVRGSHAQTEILRDCELLEEEQTLTTVASQETYTSTLHTWLVRASRIRDPMYHLTTAYGTVYHRAKSWVNQDRERVADGGTKALPPKYFYVLLTTPLTIGIWYIPDAVYQIKVTFVRGHSAADNLEYTGTIVNPVVPDECEDLLLIGTVTHILENRISLDAKFERTAIKTRTIFEQRKLSVKIHRVNANLGTMIPQGGINL
jgi:hypothetical protein